MSDRFGMYEAMRRMHADIELTKRRERDKREMTYLRSVNFSDSELAAYVERLAGVHVRLDAWMMRRGTR